MLANTPMAVKKKGTGESGFRDGVKKVGPDKYLLRCIWYDQSGKRRDTERVFYCPSRVRAIQERVRLEKELAEEAVGWTVADASASLHTTLRLTSSHSLRSHMRKICAAFGERKLSSIQPDEIQRFLRGLDIHDTTAGNVRAAFSRLYRHAKTLGQFNGHNPVLLTEPRRTLQSPEERMLALETAPPRKAMLGDEISRFVAALSLHEPEILPLVLTQLNLGCRFSEASALQWRDIDMETGAVVIRRAQYHLHLGPPKSGKRRLYALGPTGLAVLQVHRARMESVQWPGWNVWCFPCPPRQRGAAPRLASAVQEIWDYRSVNRRLHRVYAAAGVTVAAVTHAMRHTHVTAARSAGNDELLRLAVGHATPQMTATYTAEQAAPFVSLARQVESLLNVGTRGTPPQDTPDLPEK